MTNTLMMEKDCSENVLDPKLNPTSPIVNPYGLGWFLVFALAARTVSVSKNTVRSKSFSMKLVNA